jgi:S1-C subfamily serine protease
MVKKIWLTALVILATLFMASMSPDLSPQDRREAILGNIMQCVVRIEYQFIYRTVYGEKESDTSYGSGTLISANEILTCYHVFDETPVGVVSVYIFDSPNVCETRRGTQVQLIKWDKDNDLALLQITPSVNIKPIAMATELPRLGDDISLMGYPGCRINPLRFYRFSYNVNGIMLFPIYNGDSGGGVFNSRGELIGLIKMVLVIKEPAFQVTFFGYAIPLNLIKEFLT